VNEQDRSAGGADDRVGAGHDLVGAYLLNALDDRERAQFEQHLADCTRCRQEVAELSGTVAGLSADLEQGPPPALRERLLAQIADTPQDVQSEPRVVASPPTPRRDELAQRRSRKSRRWLVGIAAAAAVAVGAIAITQWPDATPDQAVVAVEDVLEAQDAVRSSETVGAATVTVVTSESLDRSVFVAENMDSPPEGRDYQLWFVHEDGTAVSAGLMPREPADSTSLLMEGDPEGAVAVGVTLEPEGGSEQPTSDPLVAVPLES
jgi:anti-sigma-K factor RskA